MQCPICSVEFPAGEIEQHASVCDGFPGQEQEDVTVAPSVQPEIPEAHLERPAMAASESRGVFAAVNRVNMDGLEGSSIPGGLHIARYGGGDDYRQVDPLLSVVCPTRVAVDTPTWRAALEALPRVSPHTLELMHGFPIGKVLPGGVAPVAGELTCEPELHLVVSRTLSDDKEHHVSLMLHGWLFPTYYASRRKGHQKFPLFCVSETHNILPPPDIPQHLRINGEFRSVPTLSGLTNSSYADQHVHKDEPIDMGGFEFCEVFFGSDMARVTPQNPQAPSSLSLAAIDTEAKRALVCLCILLPPATDEALDGALDKAIGAATSFADIAGALRSRWAEASSGIATQLDSLS